MPDLFNAVPSVDSACMRQRAIVAFWSGLLWVWARDGDAAVRVWAWVLCAVDRSRVFKWFEAGRAIPAIGNVLAGGLLAF